MTNSPLIDRKIEEAYGIIRETAEQQRRRNRKRKFAQMGAVAAVVVAAVGLCVADPVLAKELPLIGGVIERVQEWLGFGDIPKEEIITLEPAGGNTVNAGADTEGTTGKDANAGVADTGTVESGIVESEAAQSGTAEPVRYQATDRGYTFTLTDYYATNQAIFLGVKVESEAGFPEMASDKEGKSEIMLATVEEYSFRSGDPVHGGRPLQGSLTDEHTFQGLLRIDYKSIQTGDQGYYEEIPEEMTLQLEIPYFFLYPENSENKTVRGSWSFPELSVVQSDKGARVIEINEANAEGFGLESIEISPVELTVHSIYPEDPLVVAVVLDRDGRKLASAGSNTNELAVSGYDISEITIYLYDYDEYMEIKGLALKEDLTPFREMLEKNALYRKQIAIDTEAK